MRGAQIRSKAAIAALLLSLVGLSPAIAAPPPGGPAFERLKQLVGTWHGKAASGREITVSYRLVARDSVLIEDWILGPGRESLTLYHLDGQGLMATHYCPLGNQPRLMLTDVAPSGRMSFSFRDATNMASPDDAHQHSFWISLDGPGRMTRSETYREKGEDGTETIMFTRAEP